jgi:glycosyltransferase involved in cell wall biosynthesis
MGLRPEDVTVIVPTRNEQRNVGAFLASLPPDIALIAVDASDDDTANLIQSIRPKHTRIIRSRTNVTAARQAGAQSAQTPWLLFTDADVLFSLAYFNLLEHVDTSEPALGLIYGVKHASDRYLGYHRWFARGQRLFATLGIPAATGSNLLISQRAFKAVGGFDLRLTCNEDSEIAWRVRRAGFETRFQRDLIVYARDHRRLERSVTAKVLHSSMRCALLYFNLMPSRWRNRDWGYWRMRQQ